MSCARLNNQEGDRFSKRGLPFEFAHKDEVEKILKCYPKEHKRSALLPLLELAQRECEGWLPLEAMEYVAHFLELPLINVLEVATFYTMFYLHPVGKLHVKVCRTLSCELAGSDALFHLCKEKYDLNVGETKNDITLSSIECLGACVSAPVVQINNEYIENLTPLALEQVLDKHLSGLV